MPVRRSLVLLLIVAMALLSCSQPSDLPEDESGDPVEEPSSSEDLTPATSSEPVEEPAEPEDTRPRSPLTGTPVDPEVLERPMLLAKIENSPQARPQSGLERADVVYEELVEGGVTRFFTVFHSQLPEVAGPIRSARPIDIQLMGTYGRAGFAYSGAREEVQTMLASTATIKITEGGAGFYRDSGRHAPHNLYLRPTDTLDGVVERGAEPFAQVGWWFDEDAPDGAHTCPSSSDETCTDPGAAIEIPMSSSFRTGWEYDAAEGVYRRFQNGDPFLVTGSGRIGAANVVVIGTRHYVGATGYPETDAVTETGPALVLRDGRRYTAEWSKPDADAQLTLTSVDGDPFPLKPGSTWVHMPPSSVVEALAG